LAPKRLVHSIGVENIKSAKLICPRGDTPFGGTFLPDWKPGQILPFFDDLTDWKLRRSTKIFFFFAIRLFFFFDETESIRTPSKAPRDSSDLRVAFSNALFEARG
jgi:hypothetical protein